MSSQCQAVGESQYKTWEQYRKGCFMTFGGGYQNSKDIGIFHHGINTVFNLLESEFPSPEEIHKNCKLKSLGETIKPKIMEE